MMFLLKALGVVRNVTSYIIELFKRYPLQIILVLVCIYAFWQKTRYDAIVSEYDAFRTSIVQAGKLKQLQNDILRKKAEESLKDAELIYDNNLKAIKNEYIKKQKLDSVTISDLRQRLRDNLENSSFGVPESASDTSRHTESERECYAAYSTLESACKITTADFNAIRSWADTVCETVGCEASR